MAHTISELLRISYILRDFSIDLNEAIPLYCDNQSAIQMLANPVHHEKTKHIDIDYQFSRFHYSTGFIKPIYIESKNQLADIFTKALRPSEFMSLMFKLNMECFHVQLEGGVLEEGSVGGW